MLDASDHRNVAGKCPECSPDIRSPRHSCLQFRPKRNLHLHNQRQQQPRRRQRLLEAGACGCGGATSRCRSVCLQLNLNHFVQVRLPWEPGLEISHNKKPKIVTDENRNQGESKYFTPQRPLVDLKLKSTEKVWRNQPRVQSITMTWSGQWSHGTVKSCSDH